MKSELLILQQHLLLAGCLSCLPNNSFKALAQSDLMKYKRKLVNYGLGVTTTELHVEGSRRRVGRVTAYRTQSLVETTRYGTCRCYVDCQRLRFSFLAVAAAPPPRGSLECSCPRRSLEHEYNLSRSAAVLASPAIRPCTFHTLCFCRLVATVAFI